MNPNDPPSGIMRRMRGSMKPLRILCVEDNESDYRLLREHLKESWFTTKPQIELARTLEAALVRLEPGNGQLPFDVILLDLTLPDSNGLETFERIQRVAPDAAITILSGSNDHDMSLALVQGGAQDYLPKDAVNADLLTRSILYAVERQRHRSEMAEMNHRLKRAKDELETAQMQLIQAEKLESLGRLAASVAHEVKNPLGTLQMGVDFFSRRRPDLGDTAGVMLDCMQDAITRADRIVREMLDFSRSENLQMRPCSVNDLVTDALHMVQHELTRRKITVVRQMDEAIPFIRADRSKLEQVMINIVINAAQAMAPGGVVEVQTRHSEIVSIRRDEGLREMNVIKPGDEVVVIEVRDQGPGIPPEVMRRIFEPFFTTKPTGEGTGLGLPVAKRIIELHRGHLHISNRTESAGVQVRIILKADPSGISQAVPRTEQSAAPAAQSTT